MGIDKKSMQNCGVAITLVVVALVLWNYSMPGTRKSSDSRSFTTVPIKIKTDGEVGTMPGEANPHRNPPRVKDYQIPIKDYQIPLAAPSHGPRSVETKILPSKKDDQTNDRLDGIADTFQADKRGKPIPSEVAPHRNNVSIRLVADHAVRIKKDDGNSFKPLPKVTSSNNKPVTASPNSQQSQFFQNKPIVADRGSGNLVTHGSATPQHFADKDAIQKTQTSNADFKVQATDILVNHQPPVTEQNSFEAPVQSQIIPASATNYQPLAEPPLVQGSGPSQSTQGTTSYRLADQPKIGDHYKSEIPVIDRNATQIETILGDFSPDPIVENYPYDPFLNQNIYQGKTLNANQRPLLELGKPWYQLGQISPGSSLLGFHNNINPQFLIFGDFRQAIASNRTGGDTSSLMAWELNTIWNLFITSTERVVWGVSPFDNGAANTRWDFDNDRVEIETDFDFDFGYLEGDLGAITGGFTGETLPFDAPFAIGLTPILIQNGVWLNDAVEGLFFTIPARNSAKLGISNMDISFGYIWDEINSNAFAGDKNAAKAYLIYTFIEALNGYLEIDYAFLEDRNFIDRSYHNIGLAYSRRFGNFISHSTRVIANAGQEVSSGSQTADGVLLLSENSLITSNPYTVIPYFNMFAGFDTPQSVAGNQQLINTGILFESDGMTGYPTLDATGNDTFGGAIGLNLLAQDFSQQLIMEFATVFRGDDTTLAGDQYGLGLRYQIPLSNSWIFRTDGMYGFLRGSDDVMGARVELRKKF